MEITSADQIPNGSGHTHHVWACAKHFWPLRVVEGHKITRPKPCVWVKKGETDCPHPYQIIWFSIETLDEVNAYLFAQKANTENKIIINPFQLLPKETRDDPQTRRDYDAYMNQKGHHVWCNFFQGGPPQTCTMCPGLNKDHPLQDGDTPDDLMRRYFPNNKKVGRI
jgi:hypothetical protein